MRRNMLKLHISRLMALLLAAVFLFACAPAASASEGTCGDDLTWSLVDGTLTIEGSGDMDDFSESTMAPWYDLRAYIRQLSLPSGLTHVGDLAFYDCSRLTVVDLPGNVRSIGEFSFASCEGLQLLDLGDGLTSIADDAFHGCWDLKELRLPQSLKSIGSQAFYDCSSITGVVIPSGVTSLGSAVFAYCTSLVRAEVQTKLTRLPDWTFFGCSRLSTLILPDTVTEMGNSALRDCRELSTVSYGGDSLSREQLKETIVEDVPGFGSTGYLTNENPGASASSGTATESTDGTVTEQITTVTSGQNSSVSSTMDRTFREDADNTVTSDITVTVENDDGWEEALQGVESALDDLANRAQPGTSVGTANVTIYVKDSNAISSEFVDSLAGRNAVVTVITKDGSSWKIDCGAMLGKESSGAYDLRYTLEPAGDSVLALMGVTQGYRLRFAEDAVVEAEVMILLPDSAIRQTATLFKEESSDALTRYQSVVVDTEGYAHLYLGSVDNKSDYFLGINVPEAKAEAVIPEPLQAEYAAISYAESVKYEITGRTSSWGMNLGQVMGILAAVMVSVIVVVGFVMYAMNKRRLKNGYVPQWDDEDYE